MGGWKRLLDAHRDMVDYRQVAASVVPAPVPTHVPAPVRALPHTNHKQTEPTPLGKERNIPHEIIVALFFFGVASKGNNVVPIFLLFLRHAILLVAVHLPVPERR